MGILGLTYSRNLRTQVLKLLVLSLLVTFGQCSGVKGGSLSRARGDTKGGSYNPSPSISKPVFSGSLGTERLPYIAPPPAPAPEPAGSGPDLDALYGPPMPYSFGYESERGSRSETSDGRRVTGSYTLVGADGINRVVHYVADGDGFRASIITNEPGTEKQNPSGIIMETSQPPAEELARKYGPQYEAARSPYRVPQYTPAQAVVVPQVSQQTYVSEPVVEVKSFAPAQERIVQSQQILNFPTAPAPIQQTFVPQPSFFSQQQQQQQQLQQQQLQQLQQQQQQFQQQQQQIQQQQIQQQQLQQQQQQASRPSFYGQFQQSFQPAIPQPQQPVVVAQQASAQALPVQQVTAYEFDRIPKPAAPVVSAAAKSISQSERQTAFAPKPSPVASARKIAAVKRPFQPVAFTQNLVKSANFVAKPVFSKTNSNKVLRPFYLKPTTQAPTTTAQARLEQERDNYEATQQVKEPSERLVVQQPQPQPQPQQSQQQQQQQQPQQEKQQETYFKA